jgi:hypothetical protein
VDDEDVPVMHLGERWAAYEEKRDRAEGKNDVF